MLREYHIKRRSILVEVYDKKFKVKAESLAEAKRKVDGY